MARSRVSLLALILILMLVVVGGTLVRTPSSDAAPEVRLTAAGDYQAQSTTDGVLVRTKELDPNANLALGDLAYGDFGNDEYAWCDYVKSKVGEGFPFQLVSGNHESEDNPNGAINNYAACLPNQVPGAVGIYGRQYYMDFPNDANPLVRVIQISNNLTFEGSQWKYRSDSKRYKWVGSAIDDARANGAKWVVVTTHEPCQSVGRYACPSNRDIYDLLAEKKVDLVLHGHEHAYMRSHQLSSGTAGCATIPVDQFNAECVADNDDDFRAGKGTVFATVGTGGTALRDVDKDDPEAGFFAAFQGLNRNPTFGLLSMVFTETALTANFEGTSGGDFTDSFTITQGDNSDPTASFTTTVTGLSAGFDASASTDSDGRVTSYDWDFGDGSTGTGVQAQHDYANPGTYPVALTVTDDEGGTGTITQDVVIGTAPFLAKDGFDRESTNGWGRADAGGPWTVTGTKGDYWVTDGVGTMQVREGGWSTSSRLDDVSSTQTDLQASFAVSRPQSGGGTSVSIVGRRISSKLDYRALVKLRDDGSLRVYLIRTTDGAQTFLRGIKIPGVTYHPGDLMNIRLQAKGTSPTTVRVKFWLDGESEPSAWLLSKQDSEPAAQVAGSVGFQAYVSGTNTEVPTEIGIGSIEVVEPQ